MNDRLATITGTQAAKAFPALATFLANSTTLSPQAAEQALRLACADHAQGEAKAAAKAGWKRAIDHVNGQIGISHEPVSTAPAPKPNHGWGDIMRTMNH